MANRQPFRGRAAGLPGRARVRRPTSRPRLRFTGRAAVLALTLCSLIAALAYPTRQFIAQRADIAAQRAAADRARAHVQQLRREKARWQDPAYVEAQARARLHYAMPGETPYVSVNPSADQSAADTPALARTRGKDAKPWYTGLWDSVDAADSAVRATPKPQ